MSQTRTIVINFLATYGRSLYALAVGIFCGRWVFLSLGKVDYGLIGVVGGMTAFIAYLNSLLSMGVGRFYALNVGLEKTDADKGLAACRQWFTVAVIIHVIFPMILMGIGYPVGEWAVRSFLTIPPDRVASCLWVWRFACCSCFIGMIGVPFSAMYGAKQEIAELTIYSFVTTTLNLFFLMYMISHPGDWLIRYSMWTCALSVIPALIICVRSFLKYKECRFDFTNVDFKSILKQMFSYMGWLLIGGIADLLQSKGVAVTVNKFLGPVANAAMNVGNSFTAHSTTLANNMSGAFWPAIYNAWGRGDYTTAKAMALRMSRMSTIFTLMFIIPMALEADNLLILWLKTPPPDAAPFAIFLLGWIVVDKMTFGYTALMHAASILKFQQIIGGGIVLMTVPLCCVILYYGFGLKGVGFVIMATSIMSRLLRVIIAKYQMSMSARNWLKRIFVPVTALLIFATMAGLAVRYMFPVGFVRICVTTVCVNAVILPISWFSLLDSEERGFVKTKLHRIFLKN